MTVSKIAEQWWLKAKTAVFQARRGSATRLGDEPQIHLYPLKRGGGFLWLIRHGHDWDYRDREIKSGGIIRLPFKRACRRATNLLLAYRGRAVHVEKPAKGVRSR
jgi:hypothetical protein